jgi:hypothetical protein
LHNSQAAWSTRVTRDTLRKCNSKNTTIGTTTDTTGQFSLSGIDKFPVYIVVSYTGFEPERASDQKRRLEQYHIAVGSLVSKEIP